MLEAVGVKMMAGQVCLIILLYKYFLLAHKESEANGQTVRCLDSVFICRVMLKGIWNTFGMHIEDLCLCDRQVLPQRGSFQCFDCHCQEHQEQVP